MALLLLSVCYPAVSIRISYTLRTKPSCNNKQKSNTDLCLSPRTIEASVWSRSRPLFSLIQFYVIILLNVTESVYCHVLSVEIDFSCCLPAWPHSTSYLSCFTFWSPQRRLAGVFLRCDGNGWREAPLWYNCEFHSSCSGKCLLRVCWYWFLSTNNEQRTVRMMKSERTNSRMRRCGMTASPAEGIYILPLQVWFLVLVQARRLWSQRLSRSRNLWAGLNLQITTHLFCQIMCCTSLIRTG